MPRIIIALLALGLLLPGIAPAVPEKPPTLQLTPYPQRMADRYTAKEGLPAGRVTAVQVDGKAVRAQAEGGPATFNDGRWNAGGAPISNLHSPISPEDRARLPQGAKVLDAARAPDGRVWVVTDQGVFRSEGGRFVPFPFPKAYLTHQETVNIDATLSCVRVDRNGIVWLGSDVGVFATDGANYWNVLDRKKGLPYEYVTCLALSPAAELWVGTTEGVCRFTGGEWQYYWGPRWLPNNHVNAIAVGEDGAAWVATDGGVARLYDTSITLARKAAHYERINAARHNRRGWVTGSRLRKPGDPSGGAVHEASDNDGLWTAIYVGGEAFRWAATKDPEARTQARKSMQAMLDLVKYSGVPGYPARALIFKGEEVDGYNPEETVRVPGETDKIWYPSPVDPNILCKGDTSSDEMDGHYFAWQVYYDLVADEAEKRQIRDVVRACTNNILDHDLTLVGHTGRKTRWGVWHPRFINDDPTWWEERGLNALEILCYLKVAHHICGDARYERAYRDLIEKHHYLLNTVTQKVAEPWYSVNHSDDEMSFMMYYSLMVLEKDPATLWTMLVRLPVSWSDQYSG